MAGTDEHRHLNDRLDDLVDRWHEDIGIVMPLHEYLGLTWAEYGHWVQTCQLPADYRLPPSQRP